MTFLWPNMLWLLLLLPVAEGLGHPRLHLPNTIFLACTLTVGLLNYLPTRLAPVVLIFGLGCGGGVIGLACAYYLLEAGRGVTVIEQGTAGCGSSHGNCGTLTPSHATPLAMPGVIGSALSTLLRPAAPLRIAPRFDPALWRWLIAFARRCNWQDFRAATRDWT